MSKFQVCVVTGSRAEYGLLRPLLIKFNNDERFGLTVVATGSHLSPSLGYTIDEIEADGYSDIIKIPIIEEVNTRRGMVDAASTALREFGRLFDEYRPDILIVLGDRYEIMAVCIAAHFMRIPIAHICGGDVTEGAIDDAIRHSITKMSTLHFPDCEDSLKRIIQLGEEPSRIYNVGDLCVENCLNTSIIDRDTIIKSVGFELVNDDYAVVTYHPVTMEEDTVEYQMNELIKALESVDGIDYIITLSNADAGGCDINRMWLEASQKNKNFHVVASLGSRKYISCVKQAKMVIGNSSSGIYEAPYLGTPTINIGNRQQGRMFSKSVICCEAICDSICESINTALSPDFSNTAFEANPPFGNGDTSDRIIDIIYHNLCENKHTDIKHFFNIDFDIRELER